MCLTGHNVSYSCENLLEVFALEIFLQTLTKDPEEHSTICRTDRRDLALCCGITHKHICIARLQLDAERVS